MDFDLAAEIVASVATRVGTVGEQSVVTSRQGQRYGQIALSRGGIVTPVHSIDENYKARRREHVYRGGPKEGQLMHPGAPEPTQPVYRPELTAINHFVGAEGEKGMHNLEHVQLSKVDSREYVFVRGEDGLWRAFDAFNNSSDNYWTKTTEYFLDAARPITTDEEGLAIHGLITLFDSALTVRSQEAVASETGLLPRGY